MGIEVGRMHDGGGNDKVGTRKKGGDKNRLQGKPPPRFELETS